VKFFLFKIKIIPSPNFLAQSNQLSEPLFQEHIRHRQTISGEKAFRQLWFPFHNHADRLRKGWDRQGNTGESFQSLFLEMCNPTIQPEKPIFDIQNPAYWNES